jgi:hypothetical protein
VLVEAQADVQADCDGCPALILAICTAVLPGREAAVGELVQLLLDAGADPMQRCGVCGAPTVCVERHSKPRRPAFLPAALGDLTP